MGLGDFYRMRNDILHLGELLVGILHDRILDRIGFQRCIVHDLLCLASCKLYNLICLRISLLHDLMLIDQLGRMLGCLVDQRLRLFARIV